MATIAGEGDTVRTIVRLDFERGSVYNIYTWGPRRLLGIRGTPQLPATRLRATSDREFVSLALGDGPPAVRIRVEEREGELVLSLGGPSAPLIARKAR